MTETYLHGSSPAEQARLELMNGLLNTRELAVLGVRPGDRVLEAGAGTGLFARELAAAVGPTGFVLGIERDEAQLARARATLAGRSNAEVRAGDAYEPPLTDDERGSFDLVHARFLLEHLRTPARAVRAMVAAVAPGGRIALVDDDHSLMRFDPDPGGMDELWQDYALTYEAIGCDPWIGRKLAGLLVEAGARIVRTDQIHYGASHGEPCFDGIVTNLIDVVRTARSELTRSGQWTDARLEDVLDRFRSWSRRAGATVWYALPFVEARRSGSTNP